MEMTVRMPANYTVMSQDEMTYTEGGAAVNVGLALYSAASIAVSIGLLVNWAQMLGGARNWYAANKTDNIATDLDNGFNAWVDYTTSSALNCVRSVLGTVASVGSPLGWGVTGLVLLTV